MLNQFPIQTDTGRRTIHNLTCLVEGNWAPLRTGDYEQDCAQGNLYANEVLALIEETENPAIFGSVVRAITAGGIYEGVETGFCSRIGIILCINGCGN